MKILKLESNNIKRIKAVELVIDDKENVVMITGKNGQGKTSVLDSIWYALGGAKVVPDQPIRAGTERAEVSLDLGDFVVNRTFTEAGTYLKVTTKDGARYQNPQKVLDTIVGQLAFDPLDFSRMEAKKQVETLIKLVGVDFSDLDEKVRKTSEDRTLLSREIKALGDIPLEQVKEAEKYHQQEEVKIGALTDEIQAALMADSGYKNAQEEMKRNHTRMAELQEELKKLDERQAVLAEVKPNKVDIPALQKQLAEAEETNKRIVRSREIMKTVTTVHSKREEYNQLDIKLEEVKTERKVRLQKAQMPIEGLAWTDEAVTYHDIPFNQLSSAEQLKISMAMAMVANPKLRVVLIRDGSLLDAENLKVIQEMAKDLEFQVWVEKVDDSGKVGIVIEDGAVKAINDGSNSTISDAGPTE